MVIDGAQKNKNLKITELQLQPGTVYVAYCEPTTLISQEPAILASPCQSAWNQSSSEEAEVASKDTAPFSSSPMKTLGSSKVKLAGTTPLGKDRTKLPQSLPLVFLTEPLILDSSGWLGKFLIRTAESAATSAASHSTDKKSSASSSPFRSVKTKNWTDSCTSSIRSANLNSVAESGLAEGKVNRPDPDRKLTVEALLTVQVPVPLFQELPVLSKVYRPPAGEASLPGQVWLAAKFRLHALAEVARPAAAASEANLNILLESFLLEKNFCV